ncbi:MAG TPA: hypothetical protein VF712_19910 [Thermoleophilaceae bacterium]|jgi:hypothetical protein
MGYAYYRREVEVMLASGCGLETIEQVVDRLPLDADDRAALWLFAWAADGTEEAEPLAGVVPMRG